METQNFNYDTDVKFSELGIDAKIYKTIEEQGFEKPTDIQAKAIPFLLDHTGDFIGQAQTGTGKTVAFVLPLLQKLDSSSKHIQALIMAPTRELANQVNSEIEKFAKYIGIKSIAVFGGASQEVQIRAIKKDKPQIIVGTPGRLMDFMKRRILNFSMAEHIVLDEADEMLNMGFFDDVQKILSSFKEDKKIWMFSATMSQGILKLIKKEFNDPTIMKTRNKGISNDDINQVYYLIKEKNHEEALCRLLDMEPDMYGLVFCKTKIGTKKLAEELLTRGYSAESLHGDMSQSQRDFAMKRFKNKKAKLMICTDVAARGIDVNNLTHVINFGFPQELESYVHRIGRTGRAGLKGTAVTLMDPRDMSRLRHLEKIIKKEITLEKLPSIADLKSIIVKKDLDAMDILVERVKEKGENFRLDSTFDEFKSRLDGLDREEILKVLFSWKFKEDIRRYDRLGTLDVERKPSMRSRAGSGDSRSRFSRNTRGDSRSSSSGDRFERSDRGERKRGPRSRRAGNPENIRLFMNAGKKDGLTVRDFVADFAKQSGIDKNEVRNVSFKDSYGFIEIPNKHGNKVVGKSFKFNERNTHFEYAN